MADSKIKAAVIGAGIMGSAIATRLIECGLEVRVFDLDNEKVAALADRAQQSKKPQKTAISSS
jgi:2-hydroxy-3-oxopropionate reductase